MLEGLDKIKWSRLHHAYGDASDVPDLIRKLLSQDQDERDKVKHELFTNIWHQGTVWEASSYAIPFLYEILAASETPDKLSVVLLLASLATGTHCYHGVLDNPKEQKTWRKILADDGKNLEDEIALATTHEISVRKAISENFRLLYPYILCDEPFIRDSIAKAFREYPQFRLETLPLLEKALSQETNEYAKESMSNSIRILSECE